MTYGFRIVQEMIAGLAEWMDAKGHADLADVQGRAVPNVTDWQYLNLNYVTKARIDQDLCIHCGRCFAACEDTSHQAIAMQPGRVFEVKDDECVACNLCVNVCPVEDCITMVALAPGTVDARTGKVVERGLRQLDDASEQPDGEGGGVAGRRRAGALHDASGNKRRLSRPARAPSPGSGRPPPGGRFSAARGRAAALFASGCRVRDSGAGGPRDSVLLVRRAGALAGGRVRD